MQTDEWPEQFVLVVPAALWELIYKSPETAKQAQAEADAIAQSKGAKRCRIVKAKQIPIEASDG